MGVAFVAGLVTMGFLIAGLSFFRFWRHAGDWFFAAFGSAFILLALNEALTQLVDLGRQGTGWVWLLRLAGFLLIIAAIASKNLPAKP